MRTKNSIKNSIAGIFLQVITIVLSFVVRTLFIKVLGIDYLGISGLFSNILTMLSLAELGIGTAIVYSMYKPMSENNKEKLCLLMKVYANFYKVIGIVVIIIGCGLIPFLDLLISDKPDIPYLSLYFFIYILNSASSYFFIYKASIFTVDQKEYIISLYRMLFIILRYMLEIFVLLFAKSFLLYLLVSLFITITTNLFISYKADKKYPFIREKVKGKLSAEEKQSMKRNISALFFHRIGNVIVNGTDNLIISKMFGLTMIGLYSNYLLIISAINTFVNLIYNAITASVGNLNVTETKDKSFEIYKNILFSNFWIGGFCAISLIVLLNPLIILWIGEDYTLNISVVIIIVINCYLTIIRKTTLVFKEAMGLFWKDRYKPLFESIINLIFSIVLAQKLGLIGVFLGSLISTVTTCFWIEPWVLFKYGFNKKFTEYFEILCKFFIITVISASITWLIANIIQEQTILSFGYKLIICAIVPNLLFLICFYKKTEFVYFKNVFTTVFKKIKKHKFR